MIRHLFIILTLALPATTLFAPVHENIIIDMKPSLIHELRMEITKYEGGDVLGALPERFNNPCALSFAHQKDAVRGPRDYALFAKRVHGERACESDLWAKFSRGLSVREVLRSWADGAYALRVARDLGISLEERF